MDLLQLLPAFVVVPAQPFLMGTPERALSDLARRYGGTRESYREEAPQHQVSLPAFALARTPVSEALYGAFVAASGSRPPITWHGPQPTYGPPDLPVVDISWAEALSFCAWLADELARRPTDTALLPGLPLAMARPRLPSEAEWEHAARGGDGRSFPWGESFSDAAANTRESGRASRAPLAAYPAGASPYGLFQMAGNIWEWTSSLDRSYPYRADDGREDLQAAGRRILRGGCYANPHGFARCACRFRLPPAAHNEFTGFRLAVSLERSAI